VEGEPIYSEDFDLGEVVKQSPQGGETVRESGLTITVQINTELDVKELRMPNVMDWDQRKALSHLQDELGMDVTMEYEYSEEIEANHVMRFMPLDGMLLRPGDPVTIVISKGPETEDVSVPLVEGVDLETATEMLEGVELAVGKVTEVESETVENGLVVFQSITATTEVPKGTAVNLQVSLGSTTSEPTPTGGQDPDPSVSPSGGDISANAVTKDISFNMVAYSGTIHLRVEVGDLLVMDGQVDTGIGTWRGTVSHTGRQRVNYYVNGELARYETIDFSS
jgi:serine/threonine-protein kinase